MRTPEISSKLLARNTFLNFLGPLISLSVGLVANPLIIRGLGPERFGLLSFAWVVLGYFAVFDLGLGKATTKYVVEALGKGEEGQPSAVVWRVVSLQTPFGLLGAVVLAAVTPLLVGRVLNLAPELAREASIMLYLAAVTIPLVLVTGSFTGLLEAAQRFDLSNVVKASSSISVMLLSLIGLALGFRLPGIIMLIVVSRFAVLSASYLLACHVLPSLKSFTVRPASYRKLLAYGGWITVTDVVGPILMYLDRFLIGLLMPVAAVGYYAVPYDVVTRLRIISGSANIALFPAFSAVNDSGDRQKLGSLLVRPIKYELLILGPLVLVLVLFAEEILALWLGNAFAIQSATAMQVLAVGVLINSLGRAPLTLLQAAGQPGIAAKLHVVELPLYAAIAWLSIREWGINGAAFAWTLRVAADALFLFAAAFWTYGLPPKLLVTEGIMPTLLGLLLVAIAGTLLKGLLAVFPPFAQSLLFASFLGVFARIAWRALLDSSERKVAASLLQFRKPSDGRS